MSDLTTLYDTVQTWRQQQGFDLAEGDVIRLMHVQVMIEQNNQLQRIATRICENAVAIDRLRTKLKAGTV